MRVTTAHSIATVESLTRALPPGALVSLSTGCHTSPFFVSEEPPALTFLARHLTD